MRFETSFISKRKHLVVYACRVADAQDMDTAIDQFFGYPVNGRIALGTDHYLVFPVQSLIDRFN